MPEDVILEDDIPLQTRKDKYDAACKAVLAHKVILAWILKCCTAEFAECGIEDIMGKYIEGTPEVAKAIVHRDKKNKALLIDGTNTEDKSVAEGTVTFDVKFVAHAPLNGEMIKLILNVEAQNNSNSGYSLVKRALYYCGRMLSMQYGREFTKSHYEQLKKVYSIWICPNPSAGNENSIVKYAVQKDVMLGSSTEVQANYDLLNVVMVNLGSEAQQAAGSLLKLLTVLFASPKTLEEKKFIISNEFDIKMNSDMEQEVDEMCNLSDGVYEAGKAAGMAAGIAAGKAEGLAAGKAEGEAIGEARVHRETALKMLRKQKALVEIMEFTNLSQEEVYALAKANGLEVIVG